VGILGDSREFLQRPLRTEVVGRPALPEGVHVPFEVSRGGPHEM